MAIGTLLSALAVLRFSSFGFVTACLTDGDMACAVALAVWAGRRFFRAEQLSVAVYVGTLLSGDCGGCFVSDTLCYGRYDRGTAGRTDTDGTVCRFASYYAGNLDPAGTSAWESRNS